MFYPGPICKINAFIAKSNYKQQQWLMVPKERTDSSDKPIERKKSSFRFLEVLTVSLIECLDDHKVRYEFSNIDFDAYNVLQYKSTWSAIAAKYQDHK